MKKGTLLQTITIPRYMTRILISKARRATYYKKGTKKKIPKKYAGYLYGAKGFLVDSNGERVISNPRSVGKPRYEQLSGNRLTSGYSSHHMRNKIAQELKNFYRPFVKSMRIMTTFPIRIEWDLYTMIGNPNFDLSNLWFYIKYFEDTLVSEGIIPEDNIEFITHAAAPRLCPVEKFQQRKFVFRFYHDNRDALMAHELWNPSIIS